MEFYIDSMKEEYLCLTLFSNKKNALAGNRTRANSLEGYDHTIRTLTRIYENIVLLVGSRATIEAYTPIERSTRKASLLITYRDCKKSLLAGIKEETMNYEFNSKLDK